MSKTFNKPLVLIKIGGRPASDDAVSLALLKEIKALSSEYHFVLVHGGGHAVTELSGKLGLHAEFQDGIRMTSPDEMEVVDQVLAGSMNTRLLRDSYKAELKAIGLSGADCGLVIGQYLNQKTLTAKVAQIHPEILETLISADLVPILSSVAMDQEGNPANINADDVAQAIAESLQVGHLIFISDIPGVLKDKKVISQLDQTKVTELIDSSVIQGGMVPKAQNAVQALINGVEKVVIGTWEKAGDLKALLGGESGSSFMK
jgi:acetylglutamate kinase